MIIIINITTTTLTFITLQFSLSGVPKCGAGIYRDSNIVYRFEEIYAVIVRAN